MLAVTGLLADSSYQPVNLRSTASGLIAQSDDPQIIFKPQRPLPSGWYALSVDIDSAEQVDPQVYFDLGGGFIEPLSTRLRRTVGNRFVATVRLPEPAVLLRLDPMSFRGELRIKSFGISPAPLVQRGTDLARHGLALLASDPGKLLGRLPHYLQMLGQRSFLRLNGMPGTAASRSSYRRWIARHDFAATRDGARIAREVAALKDKPLISVVMPVYNTPKRLLREAIESVRGQIYPNWQLCIADDRSPKPHVRGLLEHYSKIDPRIRVVYREENGHISHATNSAFALAKGDWIALLDHDDILRPHALAELALEASRYPDAQIIYSDEDKLDRWGKRYDPYFKPDYSRELFRSQNYFNHLTVHRADNIRAVGGWRPGFEGSQDYDVTLRIIERIDAATIRHIPKVLYHWRAAKGSTAAAGSEKNYAYTAGLKALEEHVARLALPARVEGAPDTPFYRVRFAIPRPEPLVSLIIPTRNRVDLLRNCINSIRSKTVYSNYEIIVVDNGSTEPETLAYLDKLKAERQARVLRWDQPFNYSAINNFAVWQAKGALIGLINNDIEVISPGWLNEMVSWAIQDDIGCVGAKLYYANDTIQHAGVILGIGGVAGHSHKYFDRHSQGYFSRLKIVQNMSAVTAACMVMRKSVFHEVGGLDAEKLAIAFNDVDLCLKVREAGYKNVWTPFAELYHLESVSRGAEDDPVKIARFASETLVMQKRWRSRLGADPYYSGNLSSTVEDFSIAR